MNTTPNEAPSHTYRYTILTIGQQWMRACSQRGIRYCHWKSNAHLLEALCGETDLDILVDPEQRQDFLDVIHSLGFKDMESPPEKQYPGMSDHLGFDAPTASLLHIHLHDQLVLGEQHIKNHRLPVESYMLDHLADQHGMPVPQPALEFLLLIIRATLKYNWVQTLKSGANVSAPFPLHIWKELEWLAEKVTEKQLRFVLSESKLPIPESLALHWLQRISIGSIDRHDVAEARRLLLQSLQPFERESRGIAPLQRLQSGLRYSRLGRSVKAVAKKTLPKSPEGKRIFVLVGADGAGKSTLSKDIRKWLSWKLRCKCFYLGIPKTRRERFRSALLRLAGVFFFAGSLKRYAASQRWLWIATQRVQLWKNIQAFAATDSIAIVDRFPLPKLWTMNDPMDGPRIRGESGDSASAVAELEEKQYAQIQPDERTCIFALQVAPETLRDRKTDMNADRQAEKAKSINALTAQDGVILIDGNRPYEDVLQDLKRRIWETL